MKLSLKEFLDELKENQLVQEVDIDRIEHHFQNKLNPNRGDRILGIFGVLGALLIGIGLILIVAHNWEDLSVSLKSILSFIPVLIGLGSCWYAIRRKSHSFAWREGSSVFLVFAIGACIALISQIYNIQGSLKGYLMSWVLCAFPLMYLLASRITSLLVLLGIVSYGASAGYSNDRSFVDATLHWVLFAGAMPFYYSLFTKYPRSNTTYFHHWIVPITVAILFFTIEEDMVWWLLPGAMSAMMCFYLWSTTQKELKDLSLMQNGARILSGVGIVIMLLVWSFHEPWDGLFRKKEEILEAIKNQGFWVALALLILSIYLLLVKKKNQPVYLLDWSALLFSIVFAVGFFSPMIATLLINIILLSTGVASIYKGLENDHLGIVNFGLLTIAALIICRFFDVDIPFAIRGLLFIGIGVLFFLVNYRIIQKRKSQ